jgi:O-methyltransferase involved in polyketide biosynthesis
VTRENRQFLARTVAWAANRGITQFIDLGCGLPTAPNTHETARAVSPGARVAYLDNDAVVLGHLHALAAKGNPGVTVVDGDVREVTTALGAVAAGIDLSVPACLLMGFLLHFFAPDAARDLVARYVAALAPGSYVVLSAGRADAEAAKAGFSTYSSGAAQVYNHSAPDFASFSAPWSWCRPAWSTPGSGARTGSRPCASGPATARRSWASPVSARSRDPRYDRSPRLTSQLSRVSTIRPRRPPAATRW